VGAGRRKREAESGEGQTKRGLTYPSAGGRKGERTSGPKEGETAGQPGSESETCVWFEYD